MSCLFTPLQLGSLHLPHRVLMAPLTRCRSSPGNIPNDLNAEYYRQRASAGLIIGEATSVSPFGYGYPNTPGIYTPEQVAGWKKVVQSVHSAGGQIFLQLWHVGRISHPCFQPNGILPIAPSAIRPKGQIFTGKEMVDYVTPRALAISELPGIIAEYVHGAKLAKEAGFDGVEIHNANGYLLDQFLRSAPIIEPTPMVGPFRIVAVSPSKSFKPSFRFGVPIVSASGSLPLASSMRCTMTTRSKPSATFCRN